MVDVAVSRLNLTLRLHVLTFLCVNKDSLNFNMPSLREITVFAHALITIDDEEFALLYDVTKPKSPRIPFWRYEDIDVDRMTDDECLAEFRFF